MAVRPLDNLSTSLTVLIQHLFAADELEDVRAATAHGVSVISSYDNLTLREVGTDRSLEVTLREGRGLDVDARALEWHLCVQASETRRAVSTLDRLESNEAQELAHAYVRRSGLCLVHPLLAYGEPVGVLAVHYRDRAALLDAEFDALRRFASCAGVALFNGRARRDLRDFAYTDSLTGLASRRSLDRQLASPRDTKLSLLLIDFDGLKPVNDVLGYDRGDLLIAAVGATIAANLKEGELAARLGGDEFVVVLPETGRKRAALRAEELTQILDDLKLPDDIAGLFLGASVGAATAKPREDPQRALNRAGVEMRSRKRRRKSDREDSGRRNEG